jgi:hypothetical protein
MPFVKAEVFPVPKLTEIELFGPQATAMAVLLLFANLRLDPGALIPIEIEAPVEELTAIWPDAAACVLLLPTTKNPLFTG